MFISPLRYPGGKRKLTPYIKSLLRQNDLCDGEYAEPYAGGAAVALELLMHEYVRKIHINDLDYAIYCFWQSVLEHTDPLCHLIRSTRVSITGWKRQREILQNPEAHSPLEIGFATFYLNRTSRSGILVGGPIGGIKQSGRWKLNVRYNKQDLISRVEKIARWKHAVSVHCSDALEFIDRVVPQMPSNSLIYLDPPYYKKGNTLYRNFYTHKDHVAIKDRLSQIGNSARWVVTYDDRTEVRSIYSAYRFRPYNLSYSAQNKTLEGKELIVYGPNLSFDSSEKIFDPKWRTKKN